MVEPPRPRILIVDDEEAILETMTFTFEDDYDVLTSTTVSEALELLDQRGPVAVVISDQRMPETTGVEFLAKVVEKHPNTVRIILTGFADMDAIIGAINDGHVYAYITKPWEPDDLKQVVKRAVDHHHLAVENERLMGDLSDANVFLEAVMDELDTGAIAVDASGIVQAANRPACQYLGLDRDPRGRPFKEVLGQTVLDKVAGAAIRIRSDEDVRYEEVELPVGGGVRLRVAVHELSGPDQRPLGSVILAREISHEPLRRCFEEIVQRLANAEDGLREPLQKAQESLREISAHAGEAKVSSPGMSELAERTSRTLTAIDYWLAVDEALATEDFPEAQPLMDRMRVATSRWPLPDRLPQRVSELARRVESYYESGENPKQRIL
jgi:PAS domain S-box-containing protein